MQRKPDFTPHDGFVEWELISGCWLQVGEGLPAKSSGPIRFAVMDIESERMRVIQQLKVKEFKIFARDGVPVKWGDVCRALEKSNGLF